MTDSILPKSFSYWVNSHQKLDSPSNVETVAKLNNKSWLGKTGQNNESGFKLTKGQSQMNKPTKLERRKDLTWNLEISNENERQKDRLKETRKTEYCKSKQKKRDWLAAQECIFQILLDNSRI
jgi:hypothetical protein